MPVVGLTGGIASGKSTVARVFRSRGAVVLDADEAAREVTAPESPVYRAVLKRFGPSIMGADGRIDRARLGELVFSDQAARRALEELTHPAILRNLAERVRREPAERIKVIEAALLFETLESWPDDLRPDLVIVVTSTPGDQIRRLKETRGLSEEAARARIRARPSREEKETAPDYVLSNTGSVEDLERAAERVWKELSGRWTENAG